MLSTASMIPLGGCLSLVPRSWRLSTNGAFDAAAAQLVTGLMAYGLGMPVYLGRDVLVRLLRHEMAPHHFGLLAGIGLT